MSMKLRPLPGIDLARIAPLPTEQKKRALRSFRGGGGSWSYDPARAQIFNVFNPENPLGIAPAHPSLNQILNEVKKHCKSVAQEAACVEVTTLLYGWVQKNVPRSIEKPVPSMSLGTIGALRYWGNFAAVMDGRAVFPFFDHRRANGLTNTARRFVFSMMHEQIRVADPDFENASLLIVQFPQPKDEERIITLHFDDSAELFDLYLLQEMVEETYRLWAEILEERASEPPKRATGGLFG